MLNLRFNINQIATKAESFLLSSSHIVLDLKKIPTEFN